MIIDTTKTKAERIIREIRGWTVFLEVFDDVCKEYNEQPLAAGESDDKNS